MTPTQTKIVEEAATTLAKLRLDEREKPLMEIMDMYQGAIERWHPELTRDQVLAEVRGYFAAFATRLREIDQASGGAPKGRA
jgi:hypothetical protein